MVDSNSSDIKSPAASQQQREGDSGGPPHGRPRAMMSYSCHAICCNPTSTTYDSAIRNDDPFITVSITQIICEIEDDQGFSGLIILLSR